MLLNCGLHDIKCNNPKKNGGGADPTVALDGASERDGSSAVGVPHISIDEYTTHLREAIAIAREQLQVRTVVWVRTTGVIDAIHNSKGLPWHRHAAHVQAYNAAADTLCTELKVPTIDLHGWTAALGPEVFRDHVHYTPEVEQQQAQWIMCQLEPHLLPR
jgi:hypothetical protein